MTSASNSLQGLGVESQEYLDGSRRVGWLEGRKSSSPPIERAVLRSIFRTIAIQCSPGLRDRFSTGISFPFELGSNEAQAHVAGDWATASKISFAVSSGRASMATWLDETSIVTSQET